MLKKIIVDKFGGGVMNKESMPLIKKRLQEQIAAGNYPVAVVSAFKGITDEIILFLRKMEKNSSADCGLFAKKLFKKHINIVSPRGTAENKLKKIFVDFEKDLSAFGSSGGTIELKAKISSYGEKFSAILTAEYLDSMGMPAKEFFAEDIPIITNDNFNDADIEYGISEKNIGKKFLNLKQIPVIAGFSGRTAGGQTTVLGRGGTDTTACFAAAALRADKVILWKNTRGVLSADPKIVPEAKTISRLSYDEAEESGKIIHEKAMRYVKLFKIPAEIACLADARRKTEVGEARREKKGAQIASFKKNLVLFIITDEAAKMADLLSSTCQVFAKHKVDIVLISNARHILQIAADNSNGLLEKVFQELKNKASSVKAAKASMVFLIGNFNADDVNDFNDILIKHKAGMQISAFFYENCARIEAIIKTDKTEDMVRILHKKFIK
ncbi:MAG: aspartate kinase [bacterium]